MDAEEVEEAAGPLPVQEEQGPEERAAADTARRICRRRRRRRHRATSLLILVACLAMSPVAMADDADHHRRLQGWPSGRPGPGGNVVAAPADSSHYHYYAGSCTPPEAASRSCPVACAAGRAYERIAERFRFAERLDRGQGGRATGASGARTVPEQCLFYLEESHRNDICRDDFGRDSRLSLLTTREHRYWFMAGLRLRHCCEHTVVNALAPGHGGQLENVLNGGDKCLESLDELLALDAEAARMHCAFEDVLARYDCAQPYSVIFNCTHCKVLGKGHVRCSTSCTCLGHVFFFFFLHRLVVAQVSFCHIQQRQLTD